MIVIYQTDDEMRSRRWNVTLGFFKVGAGNIWLRDVYVVKDISYLSSLKRATKVLTIAMWNLHNFILFKHPKKKIVSVL